MIIVKALLRTQEFVITILARMIIKNPFGS